MYAKGVLKKVTQNQKYLKEYKIVQKCAKVCKVSKNYPKLSRSMQKIW